MNTVRNGSALLITLLLMSGLVLTCFISWKSTIFLIEAGIGKLSYEQDYQRVRGLHEYGIWLFGTYLEDVLKKLDNDGEFTIYFSRWPTDKSNYSAKLTGKQQDTNRRIVMKGQVYEDAHACQSVAWDFVRKKSSEYYYLVENVLFGR